MRRALELGRKGRFTTAPNPRVGCVIVHPETQRLIGEGYHEKKGFPHAERAALNHCCEDPKGADLYVTLEPCCHTGSTPPCVDAILEAGIKRVVVAIQDPFPEVSGKGIQILRERGVQVETGLLEEEARYENRFFFHRHERGFPWVILKAASSLDGKLATRTGDSKWITGPEARAFVHELRAETGSILTGLGTVRSDDPLLTARQPESSGIEFIPSIRIIADPLCEIPLESKILNTNAEAPVWLFCSPLAPLDRRECVESRGARVIEIAGDEQQVDLREILHHLARKNILSLFIEGGPQIHTAFLEAGLVNEVFIFIAPILVGGKDAPTFYMGQGADTMKEAIRLERIQHRQFGPDTLINGVIRWHL